MSACEHLEQKYVRNTVDGRTHYGVQCCSCGEILKTARHHNRPWIKHSEIPVGVVIHAMEVRP